MNNRLIKLILSTMDITEKSCTCDSNCGCRPHIIGTLTSKTCRKNRKNAYIGMKNTVPKVKSGNFVSNGHPKY